ncbi:type II toxin-antitoxin system CcdA family antitoxin [Cellvibrio sp. NN19]|uniref:type II toxin-antitoxin system CcdA family antitoxin n=1 Tax=Cellvibrio chitinivorans TaxID=3102792 RepID=UPI002B405D61|nr:type II toxin-antitoxin system CcdA family antitoxin [Cellvibrio sp. NN19]
MLAVYDQNAPKKPTNLSINSDLLKKAKDLEINLSATLEQALTNQIKAKQAQQWLEQNKDSIAAYNKAVDENGVFSDGLRSF